MSLKTFPKKHGLYDPSYEKDSCGVGFVANMKGEPSHQIVVDALEMLVRMEHRGGCGCEPNTGDGAGILVGLPEGYLRKVAREDLEIELPPRGHFGAGLVFLPKRESERKRCIEVVESIIVEQGQVCLGWRDVPVRTDEANVGPAARAAEPYMMQLFIGASDGLGGDDFERQLYIVRKRASHQLRFDKDLEERLLFYICSLSTKVMIYKGMLNTAQVIEYFSDLADPEFETHLAMIHSRFSTNTFPSWDRAQPFRFMSHNGEINTLRGNINAMSSREGTLSSDMLGDDLQKLYPIMEEECSDSGNFDNALEFLLMSGRTLQEAVLLMVPEAWQKHKQMDQKKRDFYEYNSCIMEPWDGPASIVFTDGKYIGAVLDRNGLRPSRYYLTEDNRVIMASEVGVVPVDPSKVIAKGRLQPGKLFLVDFEKGKMIPDEEIKSEFAANRPYGEWLKNQRINLSDIETKGDVPGLQDESVLQRMQAFGFTTETMQFMLLPLVNEKRDPLGSMGNDAALACLSDKPRMPYDYFRQLFAQVTNPAIDSIREEVIMSLECYIGPEKNLLETTEGHAQRLHMPHPILSNDQLQALKGMDHRGWKSKIIDITFPRSDGIDGVRKTLERICSEVEQAITEGYSLAILSDRFISEDRVPLSTLLACGAVHQYLVRNALRTQIGLVLETGEAREVHHHCLLVGYGADAINPYLAFEALWKSRREGLTDSEEFHDDESLVNAYLKGVAKGMLKVMAKMGISTLHSYKGAQIFEALGLKDDVIDLCFAGTASRVQGLNLDELAEEMLRRHALGYPPRDENRTLALPNPGEFHWRADGEKHAWNPESISSLQLAARTNNFESYQQFSQHINSNNKALCTLRGLMEFKKDANGSTISIDKVEPASEIVKRFCTGAMSFGSISAEAHEGLAIAMNRLGGKSNTGEGGEDPSRFHPLPNGDSKRSAIKQIASGRFGVTIWYLTNADELQIKISQGAKPGEGGELPGKKVDDNIARIRHSTPGVGLISPPPHHDIYSIEDLAQLIHDLKNANRASRVSVKLVSEVGVGTIASGVTKAKADHILISGETGGTGASPLTSIKHAGLPWELGIAETHQTLVLNDLRSRVVLQTDGGLKTGRDVVIAALLGAEEMGFSTAPLITMGCIMMRKCHLNTCPVGIATQNKELRKKFNGSPEYVVNYLFMVAEEARQIMADLGFRTMNEMVGRVDALEMQKVIDHWKADGIDLSTILTPAEKPHPDAGTYCTESQDHDLEEVLDVKLLELAMPALEDAKPVNIELPIINTDRTVGAILSNEVAKAHGEDLLPEDTVKIKFTGSAGQSLGAFLAKGISIELEGDANDYVGKGLSGGKLAVYPSKSSTFVPEENIIIGNVCLYGATGGKAFFRGHAAERFCVRNSGAHSVIEGVGDHGCEYMTGGRAVILGPTGRNFAAGMSGGIAYIWDPKNEFPPKCNMEMVELEEVEDPDDIAELKELITEHSQITGSTVAKAILDNWSKSLQEFVKVMPTDYKRVLQERKQSNKELVA
ncbi:MAG: glutamate synthase large subunit [Verrucomicrobiota bacterium]|nr:glutamate synthase large subunit [Verrucomicrobiota bacterium]